MEKFSTEKWKKITFKGLPQVNHLEVSNFGRIRSNSAISNGGIIKGSTKGGYPALSMRYMKERSNEDAKIVDKLRKSLVVIKSKIEELNIKKSDYKTGSRNQKAILNELKELKSTLKSKSKEVQKQIKELDRERTIYYGGLIHKLVAEKFLPKPTKKHLYVIHLDYNKKNNKDSNLKYATHEEWLDHQNKNPKVKKARKKLNRTNIGFKLDSNDVVQIKKSILKGAKTVDLAKKYKVSEMAIYRIKRGENWAHVKV